jgi:hypothetical protein
MAIGQGPNPTLQRATPTDHQVDKIVIDQQADKREGRLRRRRRGAGRTDRDPAMQDGRNAAASIDFCRDLPRPPPLCQS